MTRIVPSRRPFAALLLAVLASLFVAACSTTPPEPVTRKPVPPPVVIDPAAPCTQEAAAGAAGDDTGGAATTTFDRATNTVTLTKGEKVTFTKLEKAIGNAAALKQVGEGEWLLGANLVVAEGASVVVTAPEVRWLKMQSSPKGFVSIKALGGSIEVVGACITSWDPEQNKADTDHLDGRSFLLARDAATLTVDKSELRFLGWSEVESYGLSWRTEGTVGKITNSKVSHLYYGIYSYGVNGLVVTDNEIHDSILYGVDPHTGSHDMVIERNVVHDNGKHGIILAEECTNSRIRENVVFRNKHHGIVMYLHSDKNLIENNDTFANAVQGININESSGNTISGNRVYDNAESGIGIGQTSQGTIVENNQLRGNKQDGVRLVSEAAGSMVRNNTIGENDRYGIYIDTDGAFEITGNQIFGSRTGVLFNGSEKSPGSGNTIFDNKEDDVKNR
ncbi:right-handed parallel beta-helix repeat-containing protein [Actinomycetes bacterium KLBMP 9759]